MKLTIGKFRMALPLSFVKMGFKGSGMTPQVQKQVYHTLKEYIRENGSFTLVSVHTADGMDIEIEV